MKLSEILKAANAPQEQIDAALAVERDLASVNVQSADRRKEIASLNEKFKAFDGIDLEALKKSQKDLEKIGQDKDLAAGEFEKVRAKDLENHNAALEKVTSGRDEWKKKYRIIAVDNVLLAAATHHKAINPEEVTALTRGNVFMDDETGSISIKEGDKELTDDDGKPLGVEGYVGKFLSTRQHHVQGSGGGAGSGGGSGAGGGDLPQDSKSKIARGLAAKEK